MALLNCGTLPELKLKAKFWLPDCAVREANENDPGLPGKSNPNPVTTPAEVFVTLKTSWLLLSEIMLRVAVAF